MSVLNQKTIKENIIFKGVGLHSGLEVNLTIKPAEPNTGIIFKRTDLKENNIIVPNLFNVSSAVFCTTISNERWSERFNSRTFNGSFIWIGN